MFKIARNRPFAAAFKATQVIWRNIVIRENPEANYNLGSYLRCCTAKESFEHSRIPFRGSLEDGMLRNIYM